MGCPASPWRFIVLLQYVLDRTDTGSRMLDWG
eukprot:COSAG03_NODE_15251_length_436_cov_1.845697_1_plen_31_part_01